MSKLVSPAALVRGAIAVRADLTDPKAVFAELNKGWNEFQAKYAKDQEDVVRKEEVERINNALSNLQGMVDDQNTKLAAAQAAKTEAKPLAGADEEYRNLYTKFFRSGEAENEVKAKQFAGPRAALSIGSGPDGGLTAPVEWDRQIIDKLKLVSPMRQICTVRTVSTQTPTRLWNLRGTASGWVAETAARPQTNTSQLFTISFPTGQIYAMPAATQDVLDDALVDIEAWLMSEVDTEFAFQEGQAFIDGSGVNRPKGVLVYATAQTEHPGGAIPKQTIAGGALTADSILNTVYDLPSMYAGSARFIFNRAVHGTVRRFKDTTGQYLWQPSLALGQPATLAGYPITEMPGMPNVAVNAYPLVFGDFARGYHIIDRIGTRVLRDPYTAKPYVQFYVTKRVGGGVANPEALRLLQVLA
jgi:HK97 family phage major capsid protein